MTEHELQYCWKNLLFNQRELKTNTGESIEILSPGEWNSGPGPDFLNGSVRINNIVHFGSIELHLRAKDWYFHNHHFDSTYNNVILHVVVNSYDIHSGITRNSLHEAIPTLEIKPLPHKEIHSIIPCKTHFINEAALITQLEQASKLYLNELSLRLLKHFNSKSGIELGFKTASIIHLFDLIGKPYYSNQTKDFAEVLIRNLENDPTRTLSSTPLFKHIGRGKSLNERVQLAGSLSHDLYTHQLPSSLKEFELSVFHFSNNIYTLFGNSDWAKHIIRSWLLVSMYTWSTLVYSTQAMEWLSKKWQLFEIQLPDSVKTQESVQLLHQTCAEHNLKVNRSLFLDQHKIFCSQKLCLSCNLSDMQTGS
ncbi:DUF2851 family protein [bacterium]|nr:MAG: DUF2851 family protein [bacterium]